MSLPYCPGRPGHGAFAARAVLAPLALLGTVVLSGCDAIAPEHEVISHLMVAAAAEIPAALDALPLDRMTEVRADVETALGWDLSIGDQGHELAQYAGAVVIRDPSTHERRVDPDRAGPQNGVRIIIYRRSGGGELLIPLSEEGYLEFTDEDFGTEPRIGIEMVLDEELVLDLLDRSRPAWGWVDVTGPAGDFQFTLSGHQSVNADPASANFWLTLEEDEARELILGGNVETASTGEVEGSLSLSAQVWTGDYRGSLYTEEFLLGGSVGAIAVNGVGRVNSEGVGDSHYHRFSLGGTLDALDVAITEGNTAPPSLGGEIRGLFEATISRAGWVMSRFGGDWPLDG